MPATDASDDRTLLHEILVESVLEAGALALARFGAPLRTWHKAKGSPVSETDIAVDRLLHSRLTAAAPSYRWLSEESTDDRTPRPTARTWIVDPIDGTRAYIAGKSDWSIAVALIESGRPVLGAVYAPVDQALYVAAEREGATLNGTPIHASAGQNLDGVRVAGPHSYVERFAALHSDVRELPKIHSLALRLARVAHGIVDIAFVSESAHDWDLAAADLLVHEAGGALTTLGGERLTYNGADPSHGALVAAGVDRHAKLVEVANGSRRAFA